MRRLLALLLLLFAACGSGGGDGAPVPTTLDESLSFYEGAPPWPLAGRQAARILAAGLPQLKAEGALVHYHARLDVSYDGGRVIVPADIGIDRQAGVISPLHTHDTLGTIHVEAEADEDYTLGQLLTEWGVRVGDGCIADKCGGEVAVFVDGSIQDVFAGDLVIRADTEISLVLGTQPPASDS